MRIIEDRSYGTEVLVETTPGKYSFCDFVTSKQPIITDPYDSDFHCKYFYRVGKYVIMINGILFKIFHGTKIIYRSYGIDTRYFLDNHDFYYYQDDKIVIFNLKTKELSYLIDEHDIKYFFPNYCLKHGQLYKRVIVVNEAMWIPVAIVGELIAVLIPEECETTDNYLFQSQIEIEKNFHQDHFLQNSKSCHVLFVTLIDGVQMFESENLKEPIVYTKVCHSRSYGWFYHYIFTPKQNENIGINSPDHIVFYSLTPKFNYLYLVKKRQHELIVYAGIPFPHDSNNVNFFNASMNNKITKHCHKLHLDKPGHFTSGMTIVHDKIAYYCFFMHKKNLSFKLLMNLNPSIGDTLALIDDVMFYESFVVVVTGNKIYRQLINYDNPSIEPKAEVMTFF